MQRGIDGIWNDMNEPSVFDGPESTMPDDNIHRGGGALPRDSHLRYHNVYGMLMVKASREGMLDVRPDERPFILSRANFLGGQRYAATWTGDNKSTWEHLEMSIPMSLNLSLSGQPFNGPDIGGFVGDADGELLAHWTALGAFYPFSRNHTGMGSARQEPWSFGKKVEDIARNAIERRYKLMPYLYTLFREASQTGMPIMRPLFFADPDDPRLRDEQEAFLLGGKMMVVPRWSENPDLPEGKWRNVPVIEKDSTFDQYQPRLKVKPGSVIPVGPVIQSTEDYSTDSLTLVVSLDDNGQATGTLYDDAGNNFNYKKGEYLLSWFHAEKTAAKQPGQQPAKDDVLKVEVRHKAGKWALPEKTYRIQLLTDQGIFYSKWQTGDQVQMPWPVE
jgi:alpha-glucosidase